MTDLMPASPAEKISESVKKWFMMPNPGAGIRYLGRPNALATGDVL